MREIRESLNIGDIPFGVEIEFDGINIDKVRNMIIQSYDLGKLHRSYGNYYTKWKVEDDSSVTDDDIGGEVISPILTDKKEFYEDISFVCNLLRSNNGYASEKTGAHIHISSAIIKNNVRYFINFLKLWVAYEDIIFKFGYNGLEPRKDILNFACPMYKYYFEHSKELEKCSSFEQMFEIPIWDEWNSINIENFKYAHINNTNYKSTIEIRNPNGTLDPLVWQNNLNLFIKLIKYASQDGFDEDKIINVIMHSHYASTYQKALKDYMIIDIKKATDLANLIFKDDIEKHYFLKQYQK